MGLQCPLRAHDKMLATLIELLDQDGRPRLCLYGGAQPAPDEDVTDQTLLAELELASPSFVRTAPARYEAKLSGTSGAAGRATWGRLYSGAWEPVCDFDIGTTGEDATLILDDTWVPAGAPIDISFLLGSNRPASAEQRRAILEKLRQD